MAPAKKKPGRPAAPKKKAAPKTVPQPEPVAPVAPVAPTERVPGQCTECLNPIAPGQTWVCVDHTRTN